MKLTDLPIDRPVGTLMLLVSLMVLGAVALFRLPLAFMPMIEEPMVQVVVPYPGSHPLEVLRTIVRPLEEEIATVDGVLRVHSTAEESEARVRAEFGWSENLDAKKVELREAVERVRDELPEEIGHVRIESFLDGPGGGAILHGRISANRDLSESWDLLEKRIKRPLERVAGVARVDLGGVEPQQVRIDIDPDALRRHGVQPSELHAALQAANLDTDLGALRGDVLRYDVRAVGRFRSLAQIAALPLGGTDRAAVRLSDVARVELREPELDYGRHLDRDFAISIEVFKEPAANTVDTVDMLLERVERIERDPELRGIELLVWNNAGEEIRRSLRGLRNAGLMGGALAVAVLFFFLRRVSTTLIVAVAIPFSLVVTCGAMYLLGAEFNVLTMLGLMLGVGMLVDNAVVVIENIYRRQGLGEDPMHATRVGAREVALAVLASTATTVVVWSWLFVSEPSHLTIYMGEVATVICLAVACSLLVSLTFIPLTAARFTPRREVRPGFVLRRLVPAYRGLLDWTLRHRFTTLVALLLLGSSATLPILWVEKSGEPKFRDNAVAINYQALGPTDKQTMEETIDVVEAWLDERRDAIGYDNVYSWYSARGIGVTRVYLPYERADEDELARVRELLRPDVPVIPGVKIEVGERMWGWRRHGGDRRMVSVALHGEDPEYLEELGADVERRLRRLDDVREVYGPTLRGQQEVRVLIDPERTRAVGLTPRDVARTVAFSYRGQPLRRFYGDSDEVEMLMGLPEELQPGVAALRDLPIPRADGTVVPLGSVAEIRLARTDPRINREDRRTTTWVNVEFAEEVTTDEGKRRIAAALAGLRLPEGYSWDWGSWGRQREDSLATMTRGVLLSMLMVVLLMAALFESFTQPLAILVTLPLAFFGGFWALWLGGYELDAVGFMGVIVLIGIVVNNGIVMVDHVNNLRRAGRERVAALIEGCGDRLRPVLMTAITTLFGLIPLALSKYTVANAYVDSLAVVVIGGLATSTLFTLLALPVWYTTLEDLGAVVARSLPRRRRAPRRHGERGVLPPGLDAAGGESGDG